MICEKKALVRFAKKKAIVRFVKKIGHNKIHFGDILNK
jgi:hypothetical protein